MPTIDALQSLSRFRRGLLGHVETMFAVLEELERPRGGRRLRFLTEENWLAIQRIYDHLGPDFRALLILGVVFHDIGKFAQWDVHAHVGADMVADLFRRVPIHHTDLGAELAIGSGGQFPASQAGELLRLLVKHHEVYGNFFTGEQSLLGWESVVVELRSGPIGKFLETVILLTVADVASQANDGYLYNRRIASYLSAHQTILDWVSANRTLSDRQAQLRVREELVSYGADLEACVTRVAGLSHSFSPDMDRDWPRYMRAAREAIITSGLIASGQGAAAFAGLLTRVKKLPYALRWCEKVSGTLQADGSGKPVAQLKRLVALLWVILRPLAWRRGQGRVVEVRFPVAVDEGVCGNLAEKLDTLSADMDPGGQGFAAIEADGWTPFPGFTMRLLHDDGRDVVLECRIANG